MRRLLLLVMFVLLTVSSINMAQDEHPTLRELAHLNGIDIGAAVYSYHLSNPDHAEILSREFNTLTHEQEAKPCEIQPQRGRFNFATMDRIIEFAQQHDMSIHGHTLIWHSCTPGWLSTGNYSREEAIGFLRDYIMTVVGRYKGRIPVWDVVNEGIDDDATIRQNVWQQLIGDDYIEMAFQFAHEADPDAILLYNDYGITGLNAKSNTVYEMAQNFVERGIPIHGVGLQGHMTMGTINRTSISRNIERLGELGLEVHFTEIDVRHPGEPTEAVLNQQARDYHTLMSICLELDACTTFIVWGVSDRYTWLRGSGLGFFENPAVAPLLFDDNYEPKPAYFALLDLLAREAGLEPLMSEEARADMLGIVADREETVEIPEPTKSDADQLAPDSFEGQIYYAPYPVTILLDGKTDDWENVPHVTVNEGPMLPADSDTRLTFAVAVDDTHLYYLGEVTDSEIVYGNYGTDEWYREDSVEFYLNMTGDLDLDIYESGVVQIGIMAANLANVETPLVGGSNNEDSAVDFVITETETGYLVEASVPLVTDVWSIEPAHLLSLGFQTHLNGASGDDRDTKLIWSAEDTQDNSWQNPSVFGELVIWNIEE